MNRIDQAYALIKEFEEVAQGLRLNGPNLNALTEMMASPDEGALRLFALTGHEKSPTAQWMANYEYDHRPPHSRYKNDCFCIAHLFDLDPAKKKESGLWVIENSMGGYYDSITQGGFDLTGLLCKMGAMDDPVRSPEGHNVALAFHRITKMVESFKITKRELADAAENVIKGCLNQGYGIKEIESTYWVGGSLVFEQLQQLRDGYLPASRRDALEPYFTQARANFEGKGTARVHRVEISDRV
ncbi:MAG: hypothetical protein WCV90_00370 [Candidatus Woesearchaeota archaeon]|jgi:hypothetical protein